DQSPTTNLNLPIFYSFHFCTPILY
ncbi:hypothetical protein VCHENC02_4404B, partial [Vibrio harveyi]